MRLVHTPATFIDDTTLRLTEQGRLVGSARLNGPQAAQQPVTLTIAALGLELKATTDAQGEAQFDAPAPAALQRQLRGLAETKANGGQMLTLVP